MSSTSITPELSDASTRERLAEVVGSLVQQLTPAV
jgi:hypothetical protein